MTITDDTYTKERSRRRAMVKEQLVARGLNSPVVLAAMERVPREVFLPQPMRASAYDDSPLPIAQGQTISQPYMVAYMLEALLLHGGERVLEVGTGSGYAAAVLAEIAETVYTLERHAPLADSARQTLRMLDYSNIEVINTDGTRGWPAAAPYEAIVVAAAGREVPRPLLQQLAIGGRLIIPVGEEKAVQTLMRITRLGEDDYREERLSEVRFVPLIADPDEQAAALSRSTQEQEAARQEAEKEKRMTTPQLIAKAAEPIDDLEQVNLDRLLERIGDARVVLIGEASHGTSEFYRFRARITRELIEKKGFNFVAAEADWPDAKRIDDYVRHSNVPPAQWTAFARFPEWMWRNQEVQEFVDWLHEYNGKIAKPSDCVAFHGLDLYSLYTSIEAVLDYLDRVDPETAAVARVRYGCMAPYQSNPSKYGLATTSNRYKGCEADVGAMLSELLKKRAHYTAQDGDDFLDAVQNARLIANAERYYRGMYSSYSASWNLRDSHMFETLEALLAHHGNDSKAIVWEHNSHIGDASATDMLDRGQLNVGQLCRETLGDAAYAIGFGTNTGTVAAASEWGGETEIKQVRPSMEGSWERLCHQADLPSFMLGMRNQRSKEPIQRLKKPHLERAIGVIYRPESERSSHYFYASLAQQFDEYVWFDRTNAVTPLDSQALEGLPDTYPFGI